MQKVKRKICLLMLMTMLVSTTAVYGVEQDTVISDEIIEEYVNTSNVSATLSISSGIATCMARNAMSKSYPSKITMTLQKSKDKSSYSKVTSWSEDYTGVGSKLLSKSILVSKGYYYRLKVVVKIYSGSTVIEKITKYSNVIYY